MHQLWSKSLPPTAFGKLHELFYTTVSSCTLSRCYVPAAYPECRRQNTTAISRTIDAHAPAVIPGYPSSRHNKLTQSNKLYENFYLHSTCGPRLSR